MAKPYQPTRYTKHWFPLESNPEVFTELIHALGVSETLHFEDVLSLDEPDLIALVPRPVLALILVFPSEEEAYEELRAKEDKDIQEYVERDPDTDVVWFKQTINNACGLYGILHAICNGQARDHILPNTPMSRFLQAGLTTNPREAAKVLETSDELERVYAKAAAQGDSVAPENPEASVDFHYVCFVRSTKSNHVYELDGERKGPLDRGEVEGGDLLDEQGLKLVRDFVGRGGESLGFNLMALSAG